MDEEKTLSTETVYEGQIVKFRIDTVEIPGGRQSTREIVEHADVVAVVVLDEHGEVVMVDQFRKAIGQSLLEIPAGGIDPGEDAVTAVKRELREEIGYLPRRVEKLGGFYAAPGYCTEYLHLFLATDLVPSRLYAEDTNGISLVRVPLAEVAGLITSGRIYDGKSVAGLLLYLKMKGLS